MLSDLLQLYLWVIVSHQMGAGNLTQVLCKCNYSITKPSSAPQQNLSNIAKDTAVSSDVKVVAQDLQWMP